MYHPGGTIRETLRRIERNEYVLPAIQREFVWSPDQICALFDSLLQGYPFGEFLFWQIDAAQSAEYRYYGFSSTITSGTTPIVLKHISFPEGQSRRCSTASNG